jgi:hypothetical protein
MNRAVVVAGVPLTAAAVAVGVVAFRRRLAEENRIIETFLKSSEHDTEHGVTDLTDVEERPADLPPENSVDS